MKHLLSQTCTRLICGLLISSILVTSGCATILNGRYQKVVITTPKQTTVKIDGETCKPDNGKYKLRRDGSPKQITIEKKGHKSENITVFAYKKSPLYIMSWIPFAFFWLLPPLLDKGVKSFDYDRQFDLAKNLVKLPRRDSLSKDIRLNNVAVELNSEDIKYRYFPSYRSFKSGGTKKKADSVKDDEPIQLENTIFTTLLNEVLKNQGYIDTTKKVFASSYSNNLSLNATITDYTIHIIADGMVYIDLHVKWEAIDYYKNPVFDLTTKSSSGQFAFSNRDDRVDVAHEAIKDALEFNLIKFMNHEQVKKLLHDKSAQQLEAAYDDIFIPAPVAYASSLAETVKASVTIKTKDGHGSGFIVSDNGYIITNYHVISDTTNLRVVMNDKTEYPLKVVRVSKMSDLALIKIDVHQVTPLRLSPSKDIEIAADIYTVGTPTSEDLSQTVSKGIISGIRNADGGKLIQTDASINGGNSGGAIVNKEALVLGVVSSKLTGFGIEGVAFGIPAYEIFDRLKIKIE